MFVAACGRDDVEVVPTGDDLDVVVNFVATEPLYVSAVERCLDENGGGGTEWRLAYEADAVQSQPALLVETGLAQQALQALNQPIGPTSSPSGPPGLTGAVEMDGVEYAAGCPAYAEKVVENDPLEASRKSLFDLYLEQVTIRVAADQRWIKTEVDWSQCMAQGGFDGLTRPGDITLLVSQRISDAGNDRSALEAVLAFDRLVSAASLQCWDDLEIGAARSEVRAEYEEAFVEEHKTLILSVAEGIEARTAETARP
jgi:hypothetical protein